jgi:enoyl-CoA hydratase
MFASRSLRSFSSSLVKTSTANRVATVTLNRPEKLNALCDSLVTQVTDAIIAADSDPNVGAIVLTGSAKAFAAGADISEMSSMSMVEVAEGTLFKDLYKLSRVRKPIIAAVSGYALGGGCELAMACDIIYADAGAKFGQPEVNIGTIPGIGGTQRLTHAIGKSKAMEMVLTGRMMDAREAEASGLVAKVVDSEEGVVAAAEATAASIAAKSGPIVALAKEAVNLSQEVPLAAGLTLERKLFEATFATADQKEGMAAFVEKRKPAFTHK